MSVYVMAQVWKRYPNGGGEMLLALALADHAHDDGTHIWPSIKQLAAKTRQSERTVQYQLRNMEASGWLLLVNAGNGGRNMHRQYHINPDWMGGAEIAPVEKGANGDGKGATDDGKGATAIAPADNHQEPPKETPTSAPPDGDAVSPPLNRKALLVEAPGLTAQEAADWLKVRKDKRLPLTATAWGGVKAEAEKAGMTPAEAVRMAALNSWAGFKAGWLERQDTKRPSGAWWALPETMLAKANEVGVGPAYAGEPMIAWRARIDAAINNGGKPPERARPLEAVTIREPLAQPEAKPVISEANRAAALAAAGLLRKKPGGDAPAEGVPA